MDTILLIWKNFDTICAALLAIVTLAALFTNHTTTPDPDTGYGKVYRFIEKLRLMWGKAKDSGPNTLR
jgi:hypothetical protein